MKLHNPSVIIIITRILPSCQASKGQERDGKDGAGPSPITAQLMFQAMGMSPGQYSSGNTNRIDSKDQNDHQLLTKDHDKKHHETDNG